MGNKLGRRRQVVDEKYTRPQGLYQHKDVDHKKLRKLILEAKLAPCYLGEEECSCVLEECPICFLYYPSLNRSRCCTKSICTECFLQMKTPNSARPTQCPFCKTSNYAVEYRGVKTKEEKGMEQIEEQRVIEAKIRMRQQERLDEEERIQKRNEISSSSEIVAPGEVECSTIAVPSSSFLIEGEEIASPQDIRTAQAIRPPLNSRQTRDYEFDLDLEDIMVMEAIWLSIQENGRHKNPAHGDIVPSEQYMVDKHLVSTSIAPVAESSPSSSSPSGGLACAIAALAERQQICGESSSQFGRNTPSLNILPSEQEGNLSCRTSATVPGGSNAAGVGPSYACPDVSEAGPSYACSDAAEGVGFTAMVPPPPPPPPGGIVPESFEEQIMLAMAVSLAEARALTGPQGVPWH